MKSKQELDELLEALQKAAGPRPPRDTLLSIEQLADAINRSVRTIRRFHAKCEGQKRFKRGKQLTYLPTDLDVLREAITKRSRR